MISYLKRLIDRTTMYRLVLYWLALLFAAALVLGALSILPYPPLSLAYSGAVLLIATEAANLALAWLFGVSANHESSLITALILALIMPPVIAWDGGGAFLLSLTAAFAVSSKYLVSIGNKHLFNPAAFAAALSALVFGVSAIWWVGGNLPLLPFVLLGLVIPYKMRRLDLVAAFGVVALALAAATAAVPASGMQALVLHSPLFFFAFAMLTEPLTMPPTRPLRVAYGAFVALLFIPAAHVGSFYFTPELALLAGNLASFLASPKHRFMLTLRERRKKAEGIYEFGFDSDRPLRFSPGQYLEWTMPRVAFDARGNRRYFTIASAPEDERVALGVRFYDAPSAFKTRLAELKQGDTLAVGSLAGDFTLPKDESRKLAFIAGGVGVTPFVSMARHLTASGRKRDTVLLYGSKRAEEVAYREVFSAAAAAGLRTVYTLSEEAPAGPGTRGGMLDAKAIAEEIPDYKERLFYLSGPPGMVDALKRALRTLGIPRWNIKTDYFPGLA